MAWRCLASAAYRMNPCKTRLAGPLDCPLETHAPTALRGTTGELKRPGYQLHWLFTCRRPQPCARRVGAAESGQRPQGRRGAQDAQPVAVGRDQRRGHVRPDVVRDLGVPCQPARAPRASAPPAPRSGRALRTDSSRRPSDEDASRGGCRGVGQTGAGRAARAPADRPRLPRGTRSARGPPFPRRADAGSMQDPAQSDRPRAPGLRARVVHGQHVRVGHEQVAARGAAAHGERVAAGPHEHAIAVRQPDQHRVHAENAGRQAHDVLCARARGRREEVTIRLGATPPPANVRGRQGGRPGARAPTAPAAAGARMRARRAAGQRARVTARRVRRRQL